jgi:hypothetical protein
MSENISSNNIYQTQIPSLTDAADIQDAFKLYHFGSTSEPASASVSDGIAGHLYDLETLKAPIAGPTFTGTLTAPTINASTALQIGGVAITATPAEINILDGATLSVAELNILDGATLSTAELNLLDGVTASTAELNILDGVTSTASELNLVDGSSAGTIVNNKAVIYNGTGDINTNKINGLTLTSAATGFTVAGGTTSKTLTISNTMTLAGTDGSTLNINSGGTLGSNAFTSTSYQPLATNLTSIGNLANATGFLYNNGSGTFSYTSPSGYTLPKATSTALGGVELFSDTVQSIAANAVSSTANRTYGIQLNSSDQAVVNVPWTDANTTYSQSAVTTTGGAFLRLTDSSAVNDDVKFAGSGATTVSFTDASTITISSTDTNTTYDLTSTGTTTASINLVPSSGVTDSVSITGSGATSVSHSAGTITISSTDNNFYPTAVTMTAGSTSGPVVGLTMNSGSVTSATIPSASGTASGIVTTGVQTFAGTKTFSGSIDVQGASATIAGNGYFGGGYGATGVTIFDTGAISADGQILTGSSLTRTLLAGGGSTGATFDNSGNLIRTTSSIRYKQDVLDANFAYEDVLSLEPKTFRLKSEVAEDINARTYGGFIAEDVDQLDSLKVFVNYQTQEDGSQIPDGINYGEMVAALLSALKHQDGVIKSLTSRIEALEA